MKVRIPNPGFRIPSTVCLVMLIRYEEWVYYRISIQQEGKRGGGRPTPAVLEGCQAGRLGQLFQYMRKYNT